MKPMSLIGGLATLVAVPSILAGSIQLDFVEQMSKQISFAENKQHEVWPGFHPSSIPTVFLLSGDDEYNAYAIHFKPVTFPWVQLPSQTTPIYYLKNMKVLNLSPNDGDTVKLVENQQSYIHIRSSNYIESEENFSNKYMLGRASYYLKHEANIDAAYADFEKMTYDRFNDPLTIKLVYLEDAALTKAQQLHPDESINAMRDAVAIRQYRNQLLTADELFYENFNEFFIGTPYFISWTTKNLSDIDYSTMTQRTGCYPLNSLGGPFMLSDCSMRGLPALASAAYGKMLDRQPNNPQWKNQAVAQFKSIPKMATAHFKFTNIEAKQIAERAMTNPDYHWNRISKVVDHTMTPYLHSMHNAAQEYANMPGVTVRTTFALGFAILLANAWQFQDNVYSQSFNVNNKTMLLTNINFKATSDDNNPDNDWLFDHVPYLSIHFESDKLELDFNKSHTDFKVSEDAVIVIDDIKTSAAELIKRKQIQSFNRIHIIDSKIKFSVPFTGSIDTRDGSLVINFNDINVASRLPAEFNAENYFQLHWNLTHSRQNQKAYKNILRELMSNKRSHVGI